MGIILTKMQTQHRIHRIPAVKTATLVTKHQHVTPQLVIIRAALEELK